MGHRADGGPGAAGRRGGAGEARYRDAVEEFVATNGQPATAGQRAQLEEVAREQARREIIGEAMRAAAREKHAQRKIHKDGGLLRAFSLFVTDLCTLDGAAIRISFRTEPEWHWEGNVAHVTRGLRMRYDRISPFDVYFQPGIEDPQDGWFFLRHSMTRSDLEALVGTPASTTTRCGGAGAVRHPEPLARPGAGERARGSWSGRGMRTGSG